MLTEGHSRPSGDHLGIHSALNKVQQKYYGLQAKNNVEKCCCQCATYAASHGLRTMNQGQVYQYNVKDFILNDSMSVVQQPCIHNAHQASGGGVILILSHLYNSSVVNIRRPPLWSSGHSFWLQIQRSRVRFPALSVFLRSSGSGMGFTQPHEDN
jgi:hypothetical protein